MVGVETAEVEARNATAVRAVVAASAMLVLALAGILLTRESGRVATVWLANAAIAAILLRSPDRSWRAIIVSSFTANVVADLATGDPWWTAILLAVANAGEVLVVCGITRRKFSSSTPFDDLPVMARFALAAIAGCTISAIWASLWLWTGSGAVPWSTLVHWWVADVLGLLILTPLLLALTGARHWPPAREWVDSGLIVGAMASLAALVFTNESAKLFMMAPVMLIGAFRLRVGGAALAVAVVAAEAILFTIMGQGPIAASPLSAEAHSFTLQAFIAAAVVLTLPVSALTTQRDRLFNALAESEMRHRVLSDNSSDIIARIGTDGTLRSVSRAALRIFGRSPEEAIGTSGLTDIHPDDVEQVRRAFRATVGGRASRPVSYRQRRKDGRYIWVEAAYRVIDSSIVGEKEIVASVRDVDRRRRAELRAERSAALLRQSNRLLAVARDEAHSAAAAKSRFLAMMSHEIRTPMTGVLGMIELLRSNPVARDRDRFLETLKQSADMLMAVLDDVLDFAKIESGRLVLDDRNFDLAQIARATVDLFGHAASTKGLLLASAVDGEAPAWVHGDPVRLQQVLSNLVSNAIKFTDDGRISIVARTIAHPLEGRQRWRVEVQDSGIGIARDQLGALFEPFVQAETSISRQFGGTGLGLAISRRLIEAMGGELGVDSVVGRGSTFWFEVDFAVGESPEELSDSLLPKAKAPITGALSVLVAEDNPVNAALIAALLRRMGHRSTIMENGRLAVEAAAARRYDRILMDMQMPEMDGVAATRAIRASGGPCADVPIIALTADASPERRRFYDHVGLSGFLTKPIDHAALERTLGGVAAGKRKTIAALPVSDSVREAYRERKRNALVAIEDALNTLPDCAEPEARLKIESIASAAHQLAGVAGSFGESRLGEAAASAEGCLRQLRVKDRAVALNVIGDLRTAIVDAISQRQLAERKSARAGGKRS